MQKILGKTFKLERFWSIFSETLHNSNILQPRFSFIDNLFPQLAAGYHWFHGSIAKGSTPAFAFFYPLISFFAGLQNRTSSACCVSPLTFARQWSRISANRSVKKKSKNKTAFISFFNFSVIELLPIQRVAFFKWNMFPCLSFTFCSPGPFLSNFV